MDKLKYIKIEDEDGNLSDNIPLGVDASNVDTKDGNNLQVKLDDIDKKINNQGESIILNKDSVDKELKTLANRIDNLTDASPIPAKGVSEMTDTSRIYVNNTDGYWYYYNDGEWTKGGVYQATEIADESVDMNKLAEDVTQLLDRKIDKELILEQLKEIEVGSGMVISNSNTIITNINYTYKKYNLSEYINNKIFVSGMNTNLTIPLALFYNNENDLISYYNTKEATQNYVDLEIDIPENTAYMIVNGRTSDSLGSVADAKVWKGNCKSFQEMVKDITSPINSDIIQIKNEKIDKEFKITELKEIESSTGTMTINGSVSENSNYTHKKYDVNNYANTKIYVTGQNVNASTPIVLFYNNKNQLISSYNTNQNSTNYTDLEIIVPNTTVYMIVNGRTSSPAEARPQAKILDGYKSFQEMVEETLDYQKDKELIEYQNNPFYKLENSACLMSVFTKIACIGDSLTKGGMEWNSGSSGIIDYASFSYPIHLQRILNNTVYNFGSSGACASSEEKIASYNRWNSIATTNSWLSNEYKAECYIIALRN